MANPNPNTEKVTEGFVVDQSDTVVCVDRSQRLLRTRLITGTRRLMLQPELIRSGPGQYCLAAVQAWVYQGEKEANGRIACAKLYAELKARTILPTCLSLHDLDVIRLLEPEVFDHYFSGQALFAWRHAVECHDGISAVPYLGNERSRGELVERWHLFSDDLGIDDVAAYIAPTLA